MSILSNIKKHFYNQSLDKLQKQHSSKQPPVSFESSQTIGILFDATDLETREMVIRYTKELRNKLKRVKLLGFFDSKLNDQNFTFNYFNRRNIDWAGRPNSEFIQEFVDREFDWLFNLATKPTPQFEYISAISKARMRVGPSTDKTFSYDIMIDVAGGDLQAFIKQMELVLAKTNIQHETAKI